MPSFSQSFLASLGQPRFAQGMFDVGQAIGGIGGQLAEKKRREAEAQELAGLSPDSAEYLQTLARQYEARGDREAATKYRALAEQAKRQEEIIRASQGMFGGLEDQRQSANIFAGLGMPREAAAAEQRVTEEEVNRGKTALARYMKGISDREGDLSSSKVKEGFDRVARAYGVPFEDASGIFQEALGQDKQNRINNGLADAIEDEYPNLASAARGGDPEAKRFAYKVLTGNLEAGDEDEIEWKFGTAQDRLRDKDGNVYLLSTKKNPTTGAVIAVHTPVAGAPPYDAEKQGPLELIDRLGETPSETRTGRVEQEDKKNWQKQRAEILLQFSSAPDTVAKAERAIEALERISTSGFDAAIKQVTDFTGTTSADVGVFNSSVSDFILESLGKLGANPTEGERNFLVAASASLKTSKEVNRALLNRVKNTYSDMIERGRWLIENPNASRDEYANWMLSPKEENVIMFDAAGNRITNL